MNILEPMSVFLSEENFYELSGIYLRSLIQFIHSMLTDCVLHICGNSSHLIREMCKTEADALSLDSPEAGVDLLQIASTIHEEIVFWGNLNPLGSLLNGSPDDVSADTSDLLVRMQKIPNFILSTGCDLPYDIPIENLASFMKTGREFSNW
jgi:uroporphyrinogen decarboxylase